MALKYYEHYERIYKSVYNHGIFINPRLDNGYVNINESDSRHGGNKILKTFRALFNPIRIYCPSNKDMAIEIVTDSIKYLGNLNYIDSENYIKLKLYQYFLEVYASTKTKFEKETIEMAETTGYSPKYWDYPSNNDYRPKKVLMTSDEIDIAKSILIQSCNIDSVESQWPRTIQTSKFNSNEYFYNYLLMDWEIQIVPKRVMNKNTQRFADYKLNPFMISDKEKRLKDEIISIKARYALEDREQFFK